MFIIFNDFKEITYWISFVNQKILLALTSTYHIVFILEIYNKRIYKYSEHIRCNLVLFNHEISLPPGHGKIYINFIGHYIIEITLQFVLLCENYNVCSLRTLKYKCLDVYFWLNVFLKFETPKTNIYTDQYPRILGI